MKWRIIEQNEKFYPQYFTEATGWVTLQTAFNHRIVCYDSSFQAAEALKKLGLSIEEHIIT
jgi:hypothetical protein